MSDSPDRGTPPPDHLYIGSYQGEDGEKKWDAVDMPIGTRFHYVPARAETSAKVTSLIVRATGWVATYDNHPATEAQKAELYGGTRQLIAELQTQLGIADSREPTTSDAFAVLKHSLQMDSDFAWSWHCNIAMAFFDELGPLVEPSALRHEVCNRAAARFMRLCFDVDTSQSPQSASVKA